uniref:Protein NATD1 n=1 Tax=Clytia hemisphaerica TaxID=252671 RepID=A0A7M5UK92_9CNID|eukprot:TCONS_00051368-protein
MSSLGRVVYRRFCSMMNHQVLHKEGLFYIPLEKGQAVLEYTLKDGIIDMYHTGVPSFYRGQGIAKILVQDAMKYVEAEKLTVKPTCSYVLKYVNENPNPNIKVCEL